MKRTTVEVKRRVNSSDLSHDDANEPISTKIHSQYEELFTSRQRHNSVRNNPSIDYSEMGNSNENCCE